MTLRSIFITLFFAILAYTSNAQQWPGLTLLAASSKDSLLLLDTNGVAIKKFKCVGGNNVYSAYMQKGGFFYRACKPASAGGLTGGGMHGRLQKYDWNGNLVWDYTNASTTSNLHHDFCPLPNGNVLVICYDVKAAGDVVATGGTFTGAAWFEKIIELQPTGLNTQNVVWEWKMWDHICQTTDAAKPNYVTSAVSNPQLFDVAKFLSKDQFHMNGIDYDSVNNEIVFSCHFTNEFYIIDHSTTTAQAASHVGGTSGKGGDFLYRYGKPSNYGAAGGNAIDVLHDAHFVKQGANKGMISFYHNKGGGTQQSTADYVSTPRVGNAYTITAGSAFAPTTFTSRKVPTGLFSSNMGSVEEFPNGNYLFNAATSGKMQELDSNNAVLWTYTLTGPMNNAAQAHRYQACDLSFSKPATPTITKNGTELSVPTTNAYTYEWTLNGTVVGINSTFTPTGFGMYNVVVKDSFGCASNQSGYGYYPTSINNTKKIACNIYPNPAMQSIDIAIDLPITKNVFIYIINAQGKLVKLINFANKIDIRDLANGVYSIKISTATELFAEQKLLVMH
jgi:Arylsulfotransferase (ASST)/Secretion system C-terminal sorting domain